MSIENKENLKYQENSQNLLLEIVNRIYGFEEVKSLGELTDGIELLRSDVLDFINLNLDNLSIANQEFKKDFSKLETPKLNTKLIYNNIESKYKEESKDIKDKYTTIYAKNSEMEKYINELEGVVSKLTDKNKANEEKLSKIELVHSGEKSDLEHKIQLLESKVNSDKSEIVVTDNTDKIKEYKEKILEFEERVKELEDKIKIQSEIITEKEEKIKEKENELSKIVNVKNSLNELEEKVTVVEEKPNNKDELNELKDKITNYKTDISILQVDNNTLTNKANMYLDKIKELEKILEEERSKLKELESNQEEVVNKAKKEIEKEFEIKISESEKANNLLNKELSESLGNLKLKELKVTELENRIDKCIKVLKSEE